MTKNVKVLNTFFVILAVTLMLTQFQVLPAFADLTFSTDKITIPGSIGFGWSVQRIDDGFAVGEPFAGPSSSGKVYIFSSDGTPGPILTNPGGLNDEFGYSLGIDGNILVVGAPGNDDDKGIVYLFDTTGSSTPVASIPNPSGINDERMGEDKMIFFNGDLLVGSSHTNNKAGVIYQFDQSGLLVRSYTNPSGITANDQFGRSITVDGQLILTGAHGALSETGEAHVIGDSSTIKFENPSSFTEKQDDRFGWSTATTSTAYIVGAPTAEVEVAPDQIAQQGVIYLHHKDSPAVDVFGSPDIFDFFNGQNIDDQFGYWIAESNNLLLIGAPDDDVEVDGHIYSDAGSAYLFENNNHIATFHNPEPADNDRFGYSVDILDGKLIFGAPGDEGGAGSVYYAMISNEFAAKLDITADPNPAFIGEDVTLTYTVTNIGTSDLKSVEGDPIPLVTVTDDNCSLVEGPFDDDGDAMLNVGESWTFTCTKETPLEPFTETVNEDLTYITFDNNGQPQTLYCADNEFLCNSINVNIASGGLAMSISSDPEIALNGETVNINFDVRNTGTVSLFIDGSNGVTVDNESCSPTGPSPNQIELTHGSSTSFTCTVTATRSPMVFNAEATAIDLSDNEVKATAQYTLDVINREIALEISAQPDPTYVGTLTVVTYNVTNTGNAVLTIDGEHGVEESIADCIPFAQNGIVTMQPGEFIEFTCDVTGTPEPIIFTAVATAFYQNDVEIPSNSDTLTLNSISPKITLDVSASPNPVNASSTTTLTAMVTNTGNSVLTIDGLTGIVDANNNCNPTTTAGIHIINPSQQLAFTCTVTAGSSEINFDLTATALDENENPVPDGKLLNIGIASLTLSVASLPPEPIPYGDTPTITFTVTNNGTINFTDVLFDETLNSSCTPVGPSGPLTPSESRDYQCIIPAVIQDISLHGTAIGIYDGGQFARQQTITLDVSPPPVTDVVLSGIIRDFKKSHPDFEYKIADDDGIVKNILGLDKKPIYNGNPVTVTTTGVVNFNQWYNNVNGINQCVDYDITLAQAGNTYSFSDTTFFPIDGQLFGNEGKSNNYHFTYEVHAQFVYQLGQTITMTGDDDIWVFIDNRLALDQGGVLPPRTGTISLDTLGLTLGQTYDFDLFFAERHTVQSNLGITTNIQLIPIQPSQCNAVDAVDDAASTNGPPATINVLLNDSAVTSIQFVTQPSNGAVTISGTSVIYTPNSGFSGKDYFTYTASDTSGNMDTAVVTVTVTPPAQLFCGLPESAYSKIIRGTNGNDNLAGTNGNDLIIGNDGNDTIRGNDGNDCLIGGNGDDKIWGGKGNDTIEGNAGNDNIYAQDGNDTISGGDGNNKIWGGKGNDMINSGNGNDNIYGQDDNDTINSNGGDDKIWGGKGNDTVDSGSGNDKVYGNQDNDNIISGDGNDWISAGNGNDVVHAGVGDDNLFGKQGNDDLFGEDGKDMIHGGAGNDDLFGGNNDDVCYGQSGNDTFNSCESIRAFNEEDDEIEESEEPEN